MHDERRFVPPRISWLGFSSRQRLLTAVGGMLVTLVLAGAIVRSELYALPGGIAYGCRHEVVTAIHCEIGKLKLYVSSLWSWRQPRSGSGRPTAKLSESKRWRQGQFGLWVRSELPPGLEQSTWTADTFPETLSREPRIPAP